MKKTLRTKFITAFCMLICVFLITPISHAQEYDRDEWGDWRDEDGNCRDTRQEVLLNFMNLTTIRWDREYKSGNCRIAEGEVYDVYNQTIVSDLSILDIDHVVPLKEAWRSGAKDWPIGLKRKFANDLDNLVPTHQSTNRSKQDKDPAEWLEVHEDSVCLYLTLWNRVKIKYDLDFDQKELEAINFNWNKHNC